MSVAKFLFTALPPMQLPQPLREAMTLAKRYETFTRFSPSLFSQRIEDLQPNLTGLISVELIVFKKERRSEVLWHSIAAEQLPTSDVPMEQMAYW